MSDDRSQNDSAPYNSPALPSNFRSRDGRASALDARPVKTPAFCPLPPDFLSTPDDHSPPAPPLPIPNRTVKRRRADDSTDCPCESRSLSGTHHAQRPGDPPGRCAFHWPRCSPIRDTRTSSLPRSSTTKRGSIAPSLDFGDTRPDAIGAAVGDDADAIGRVRRERNGPLHQVVAAYAAERHPGAAIPPLYLERRQAVERERHRIGGLDGALEIVLHGVDGHVIDRLRAIEVDLHPVGERSVGRVVPPSVGAPAA